VTARVLDGRPVASHLWRELGDRAAAVHAKTGAAPRLAIVRFSAEGPAGVYALSLARAAHGVGIETLWVDPPEGVTAVDLEARIGALNRDADVAGIVVTQPLPDHLDLARTLELIDPSKDVDGATAQSAGLLARGAPTFAPATALAILEILRAYEIPISGRRAVVIGRSAVAGRPVAALLLAADATVIVCHRRTRNLARETRRAELLVVAAGSPGLVRAEMVNRSCVVIDAGINVTPDGVVGDVDFNAVRPVVAGITPVPGGVGPVTTMMLLHQTLISAERAAAVRPPELDRFRTPVPAEVAGG